MATWAIGDVHGCHRTLIALLERLPFDPAADRLWLVGDLVNRGPDSLGVLRWASALSATMGERLTAVLGNHDVHLLALAAGHGRPHHRRHLAEVLEADDRDDLLAWLARRPLLARRSIAGREHLLIHAGLLPGWTVERAAELARRAETVLREPGGLARLLDRESSELAEERRTFETLTRLRMLRGEDDPCDYTGAPEEAPAGCVSWFDWPGRASREAVIVAGHWAALGHRLREDLVALDSGCVYGGRLTAIRLDDREVVQLASQE